MAKELWLEDDAAGNAVIYQDDTDPDPSGFTKTTNPVDWDNYFFRTGASYKAFRNEMITQFEPSWSGYNDAKKKALVRNYIYPSETGTPELNGLYSAAIRKKQRRRTMKRLDESRLITILKSTTASSIKHFHVTIDDSKVKTYIEVTTDVVI